MSVQKTVILYLITAVVFFAIDLTWLGLVAKKFYWGQLGPLLRDQVNWGAAILFYLIFIAGILLFVVLPALEKGSVFHALVYGAFFGFVTYSTFDLTAYSLLKDFPLKVVAVDLLWGTVLSASVSAISFLAAQRIL